MSVALLFSPQGSQAVGMGRELADGWPSAAAVFERADEVLGWDVSGTCWHGPDERLNDTRQTQPCLVTTCLAVLAALRAELDPAPAFVAGHSVGEYAALAAAGVLDPDDAIRLVARRGELMAAHAGDGGMTAVIGLDRATVQRAIETLASPAEVVVANDNAPGQVVLSGTPGGLAAAEQALRQVGARRLIPLKVSGPFHSPHMAPVGVELARAFATAAWRDADVPVVSNVTAEPERDAARLRDLLAEQVRSPVEWVASVRRMARDGVDTFVECGPGAALSAMVRRIVPNARALNVGDAASLAETVQALSMAVARVRP